MITPKTSEELKMLSKGRLLGNYGKMISALLTIELIGSVILLAANSLLPESGGSVSILSYIIELLISLLLSVFMLGQAKLYMNFATNRPIHLSDIFYGFHSHADIAIKITLVYFFLITVCLVPFFLVFAVYVLVPSSYIVPFMSIALIAGAVYACCRLLSLSQCYYIAVDFPDYTLRQILAMSRHVMKKQRARLFYLYVSFLPLILLSLLSFGIGLLWVCPYMQCTLANFYLDLMEYRTREVA